MINKTIKPTHTTFLLLIITIFLVTITIATILESPQGPDDYPIATFFGTPSSYDGTEHNAILSINCSKKPQYCTEAAVYRFTASPKCLSGTQPTWKFHYHWYDQDYHRLAMIETSTPNIIPGPWSELDPETDTPDIIFAFIRYIPDQPCQSTTYIESISQTGDFMIDNNVVIKDAVLSASHNPYNVADTKIPQISATFGYRFPPVGLLDQRKRLSWRFLFPGTPSLWSQEEFSNNNDSEDNNDNNNLWDYNNFDQIELIPLGLAQFSEYDQDIAILMNQITCIWGDNIASHKVSGQWHKQTKDNEQYWSVQLPMIKSNEIQKMNLPFVLDCGVNLDEQDDLSADWIVEDFIYDPEHSVALRFLNPTTREKPHTAPILRFGPVSDDDIERKVNSTHSLNVVDLVVFDDIITHEHDIIPIVPKLPMEDSLKPIMTRFSKMRKVPKSMMGKKDNDEVGYFTIYSFQTAFEKFGLDALDFHANTTLSSNNVTMDFTGIELSGMVDIDFMDNENNNNDDKLMEKIKTSFNATYSLICNNTAVAFGHFLPHEITDQYTNPRFPVIRFIPDIAYEVDHDTTIKHCVNTTLFDLNVEVIIFTSEITLPEAEKDNALDSTFIITSQPSYQREDNDRVDIVKRSYQFTASSRSGGSNLDLYKVGYDHVEPFLKVDSLQQPNENGIIAFNTLHFTELLKAPFVVAAAPADFTLNIIGNGNNGYIFARDLSHDDHHDHNKDKHYEEFGTFECQMITEQDSEKGTATIASPTQLKFSFHSGKWPSSATDESDPKDARVKILCPGLIIQEVKFDLDSKNKNTKNIKRIHVITDQEILLAFRLGDNPIRLQYLELVSVTRSYIIYIVGFLIVIALLFLFGIIIYRIVNSKKQAQQDFTHTNVEPLLLSDNDSGSTNIS